MERTPTRASAFAPAGGAAPGPLAFAVSELYLWAAVALGLPAVGVLLVAAAPDLAAGRFATSRVFALTHTATLGWGSLTVLGAAYQMTQTLLGRRLWGEHLLPWQLASYAAGVACIVVGFWTSGLALLAAGGILVTAAAWLFWITMLCTSRAMGQRRQGSGSGGRWVHGAAMGLGTTSFALVTAWGVVLALSLRYPFWPALHQDWRGLIVHVALGFGGWFGLMVLGVSYRLVPHLHSVRPPDEQRAAVVVGCAAVAMGMAVAGALTGAGKVLRAAAAPGLAALLLHGLDILSMLRSRARRGRDLNVHHWIAVVGYGWLLGLLTAAWAAGLLGPALGPAVPPGLVTAVLFLGGWVTQAIIGQLYKVTPFLMWHYRAAIPDVLAIPRLPDLYAPPAGRLAFWLTNLGLLTAAAGLWVGSGAMVRAGAWVFLTGAAAVSGLLGYSWLPAVARGRLRLHLRRPARRLKA